MSDPEYHEYQGHKLKVFFVPREKLYPFFGRAVGGIREKRCYVEVREDLSPRVKRFVLKHELYHLTDEHTWLGDRGREIRANFVPAFRDPVGFVACVLATVFNWDRFKLYVYRLWTGH